MTQSDRRISFREWHNHHLHRFCFGFFFPFTSWHIYIMSAGEGEKKNQSKISVSPAVRGQLGWSWAKIFPASHSLLLSGVQMMLFSVLLRVFFRCPTKVCSGLLRKLWLLHAAVSSKYHKLWADVMVSRDDYKWPRESGKCCATFCLLYYMWIPKLCMMQAEHLLHSHVIEAVQGVGPGAAFPQAPPPQYHVFALVYPYHNYSL